MAGSFEAGPLPRLPHKIMFIGFAALWYIYFRQTNWVLGNAMTNPPNTRITNRHLLEATKMSKKMSNTTLSCAVGAALAGSLAVSGAQAAENPFGMTQLESGYMQLASAHEGKCGAGKCGGEKSSSEGKCGGEKSSSEGKCGGEKSSSEGKCGGEKSSSEGKCGGEKSSSEGKCGGEKSSSEGKCGGEKSSSEGKCGAGKCGSSK
jgi:uncharacterized low-complexity protein